MERNEIILNVIAGQRNDALNNVAILAADLQMLQQRVMELEEKLKSGTDNAD